MDRLEQELDFLSHSDLADELHDEGGLMTLAEAARAVGASRETVRLWVKRGQVTSHDWDGQLLVGEQSLYDCDLARREQPRGRRRTSGGGA